MDGDRSTEAEIHGRFAHLRFGRTEQFRPEPDLMAFINRPLFAAVGDVVEMPGKDDGMASAKLNAEAIAESKIAAAILGVTLSEFLSAAAREKAATVTAEYAERRAAKPQPKPGKTKGDKS